MTQTLAAEATSMINAPVSKVWGALINPELITHWSPLSGSPDSPENYHKVSYELTAENGSTHSTACSTSSGSYPRSVQPTLLQLLDSANLK